MTLQGKFSKWIPLILISSFSLFFELAVIRWLSAEVRLFAYLKNIPLLAAFMGLATGYALVSRRSYKSAFSLFFVTFIGLVLLISYYSADHNLVYPASNEEFVWYAENISYWMALLFFFSITTLFFLTTLFLFIPLGQLTGQEMDKHMPVPAYIVNIFASLLGIWLFSALSFLKTPPIVWFFLASLGIGGYFFLRGKLNRQDVILLVVGLACLVVFGKEATWSPYQRLSIQAQTLQDDTGQAIQVGYILNVQQVLYQIAMDLSPSFVDTYQDHIPEIEDISYYYNLPYQFQPSGSRVLIVGAGMGNDVAAALRNGMGTIDAVEIDPVIQQFGIDLHPEKPYDDPRVNRIVDDARSFFEKTDTLYDVVTFGLLDSHTLLSGWSSVRLDSYVYTLESLTQVRNHLKPGGLVSLTFGANVDWIDQRLGRMMQTVYGAENIWLYKSKAGTTFIAGEIPLDKAAQFGLTHWEADPAFDNIPLPTDDWPYLYMRARTIPAAYWQTLLVIGAITLFLLSRSFPQALRPDWHFWFLGAGFLLIEFTSVTRLALLFGTTWLVNALAISGVLIMILAANLLVLKSKAINIRWVYALLFLSFVFVYFFPLDWFNQFHPVLRAIGSMLLLSLPLFFSGIIFSESIKRVGQTSGPLAANLSGSVFGGVVEYTSLLWGVQSLYFTGALIYFVAFLAFWLGRKK
jgi:hypothetical protein